MFILIEFARGSNIYVDSGIIVCVRGFILFVDIQISDRNEYSRDEVHVQYSTGI